MISLEPVHFQLCDTELVLDGTQGIVVGPARYAPHFRGWRMREQMREPLGQTSPQRANAGRGAMPST